MDKSVEKTVTLFRKSYAGRLTADERAEMACLLEDESMRRLYEEVAKRRTERQGLGLCTNRI